MNRLFLGFYIRVTLSLITAGYLAFALISPRVQKQLLHNIEETLSVPLRIMADSLIEEQTRSPGRSPLLESAARRYGVAAELVARSQLKLSPDRLERLDRGDIVSQEGAYRRAVLYVRIGHTDEVVRLGPINPRHPLGEGRAVAAILLSLCGLMFGVYLLVRPLQRRLAVLSLAARSFGRGDLTARAVVDSQDAIGTLAADFNRMAHEIQRLIASQKELLRMVSHELRTPLQRMQFAFERMRSADDVDRRLDGIQRVERDLRELDNLIDELLTYVRLEELQPPARKPIDLRRLVEDVIDMQSELADEISVGSMVLPDTPQLAKGNARLLYRALGNLIKNGIHHARSRIAVTVSCRDQRIVFDIEDDGPGIPPSLRARLFQPFSRLDIERQRGASGYGLGLAIVQRIAAQHQGTVAVDESPLGGARFRLSIPSTLASLAGQTAPDGALAAVSG